MSSWAHRNIIRRYIMEVIKIGFGERLRQARKEKKISLSDLSKLIDVSVGQLSQIERDMSSPSVNVLKSICNILDFPVGLLFDDVDKSSTERYLVRSSEQSVLKFTGRNMKKKILSPNSCSDIQMIETTLEPGGASGDDFYSFEGVEVIYLTSGVLELWIDREYFYLKEGDSIYIPRGKLRRFNNPLETTTKMIVATNPIFYPG